MINIRVVYRPVIEVSSELLLSFIFEESRPPQKILGEVDWFLNGFISRMVLSGKLHMDCGSLNLIATQLKIVAPKVLLIGMGKQENFKLKLVREIFSNISSAISALKVTNVAFISPDPANLGKENKGGFFKEVVTGIIEGVRKNKIEEELWFSMVAAEAKAAEAIRSEVKKTLEPFQDAILMES